MCSLHYQIPAFRGEEAMTEKLTIKDLNCGNCGNQSTSQCPMKWEAFNGNSDKLSGFNSGNHSCGCLYHPLALQVLAAPVIEELEERITLLENARGHNMNLSGGNLSITLYREVIQLLKEGVMKP